jgi:hypothetical protein
MSRFLPHTQLDTKAQTHPAGPLWTCNQVVIEVTPYTIHTKKARDDHPCPQRDSKPKSGHSKRPYAYALERTATAIGKYWNTQKSDFVCCFESKYIWSFSLRKEHRPTLAENTVPRNLLRPTRQEMTGSWRELHIEYLMIYTLHQPIFGWCNK